MTKSAQSARTQTHTFSVEAPQAKAVYVAGSFNEWNPKTQPLKRTRSGEWSTSVELKPGHHEFKFIVDGQWCCKPGIDEPHDGCPGCVPNSFGTMNRVLEID